MDAYENMVIFQASHVNFWEYHFHPFLPYVGWNLNKIDSLTAKTLPLDISSPSLGALTCPMATISPNSPTGASLALPKKRMGRGKRVAEIRVSELKQFEGSTLPNLLIEKIGRAAPKGKISSSSNDFSGFICIRFRKCTVRTVCKNDFPNFVFVSDDI